MKRLGKPVALIIALLILVFSVVSVFGFNYYVGDNKKTVFKGFGSIDWGIDVSGGAAVTLSTASSDEALTDLYASAKVIEDRAVKFGLTDYELYVNESTETLTFVVPNSVDCDYDAKEVASYLTGKGELSIRPGKLYEQMTLDSSNSATFLFPYGDTAETVLLDSSAVKDASWFEYTEEGYTYYYVNLNFTNEGSETISNLTNPDVGRYYNQTISIWLDDRMLSTPTVNEQITTGTISFSGGNFTESKAELYSAIIAEGVLPADLKVDSYSVVEPVVGDRATDIVLIVGLVALAVILFVMIFRYRLVGAVSVLAVLAEFSGVVAVITGLIGTGHTFLLTVPGASAIAVSVMLTVLSSVLMGEKVKSELKSGTALSDAVPSAILSARKNIFDISIVLAIVSLVGIVLFGTFNISLAIFGGSAVSGIYNFSYVLFFGSLINLVAGYLLPELMLRSLYSFNAFNKPSMFGGAK
ncbi:MAG: SecDF P1 head subdomain-containing protein [Ruminococcus sp.]